MSSSGETTNSVVGVKRKLGSTSGSSAKRSKAVSIPGQGTTPSGVTLKNIQTPTKASTASSPPKATSPPGTWWQSVYFVGTEWESYDSAFELPWDFDHLSQDLVAASTEAEAAGENIYIFGATEPQLVDLTVPGAQDDFESNEAAKAFIKSKVMNQTDDEEDEEDENSPAPGNGATEEKKSHVRSILVNVPVLVAVRSKLAPPETVGINSVQMEKETILPMKSLKMSWTPWVDGAGTDVAGAVEAVKPVVYTLHCAQRRSALKRLKVEQLKKFEYAMPYIFLPHKANDDEIIDTVVNVVCTIDSRPHAFDYDWDMDDLEDFVQEYREKMELGESTEDDLKQAIRDAVKAAKTVIKEERAAKKARIEAISEDDRAALEATRFTKYYPQNTNPDLQAFKSAYINRYYGQAHELK